MPSGAAHGRAARRARRLPGGTEEWHGRPRSRAGPRRRRARPGRWLTPTDHKRIGVLYIGTALCFFVVAIGFAMLMRTQLIRPDNAPAGGQDVQRGLHHARHHHGVPLRHADARGPGQLPDPADDRGARHGLPAPERPELLGLPVRRAAAVLELLPGRRHRHRLVQLRAPDRAAVLAATTGSTSGSSPSRCWACRRSWARSTSSSPCAELRTPGMRLRDMPVFAFANYVNSFLILFAMPSLTAARRSSSTSTATTGPRSTTPPAAATRSSGSTSSGSSATPRSTSSSCRPSASCPRSCRCSRASRSSDADDAGHDRRHRASSASPSGPTTCSPSACRPIVDALFAAASMLIAIPTGREDLQLAGHDVGRRAALPHAPAVRLRLHRHVHHRRADRRDRGHGALRLADEGHLLHRRPTCTTSSSAARCSRSSPASTTGSPR